MKISLFSVPLPFSLPSGLAATSAAAVGMMLLATGCQTASDSEAAAAAAATVEKPGHAARPPGLTENVSASAPAASPTTLDMSSNASVVTTASGLRYRVLASGPAGGQSPGIHNSVTVHYHGTLTNGVVFDSSLERGQPASFGVGQVIAGWTEALQLMKPGDKWLIYIPSQLAYGSRAVGGKIPANSDLIFQVELISIL